MLKKIIPIITLLGTSALIVGFSTRPVKAKQESFSQNINAFENDFAKYASVNNANLTTTLNKYTLSIEEDLTDITNNTLVETPQDTNNISSTEQPQTENTDSNPLFDTSNDDEITDIDESVDNDSITDKDIKEINQISTLYSLSNDIEDSCDDFCELKEEISNAIIQTQDLIKKVQTKEIELTEEQRLFVSQQAYQLKNLGRQLSAVTTELSFNLSDLSQIMATNNQNIDSLSLKYLIVLDNLVNGNEMLQSGLNSLNLINQMINMNSTILPPNNQGRILYGFQQNNNPPIIKDYYIDENGKLTETQDNKNLEDTNKDQNNDATQSVSEKTNTNIDTYKNNNLNTNLDTYNNSNLPRNIDSFFNTALLDNEFMYGNGNLGYGYGNMNNMYGANPYMNSYTNYEANSRNSANNNQHTQDIEQSNENFKSGKEKKRFKLKKNIDTFKDENEPDIKTKMGNIKNSISGFFRKFKKSDLDDKIDNPIYRFDANKNEEESN